MDAKQRDAGVRRTLIWTAGANLVVLLAKLGVGLTTGSLAVLGDAIHSLTDLANNGIALLVLRVASQPPDREHPYGHRKFETLAVFGLATLLTVLAFELGSRALTSERPPPIHDRVALLTMIGVLGVNLAVSWLESRAARKYGSELLLADAQHTFSDVLVTLAVIAGWQGAANGYRWLDPGAAALVAVVVFVVAFRLFRRAIPVLVDEAAIEPQRLRSVVSRVPGVHEVRHTRSRWIGAHAAVDVTIVVAPELSTVDAHTIADAVEDAIEAAIDTRDVTVHVEPAGHAVRPHSDAPSASEDAEETAEPPKSAG